MLNETDLFAAGQASARYLLGKSPVMPDVLKEDAPTKTAVQSAKNAIALEQGLGLQGKYDVEEFKALGIGQRYA